MPKRKYSEMTDHELASWIKSGPPDAEPAFVEIYERYSKQVYIYIYRILNNKETAEDVYQETFMKFFSNVNGFKSGSIKGFLITIARNLCLNYKRNKKSTVCIDDLQIPSKGFDYDKKELQQLIDMAVDLLNDQDREILILRIYNGMSYDDICELFDISIDNARIKLYRAKQKIKEILAPYIKEFNGQFENNK